MYIWAALNKLSGTHRHVYIHMHTHAHTHVYTYMHTLITITIKTWSWIWERSRVERELGGSDVGVEILKIQCSCMKLWKY